MGLWEDLFAEKGIETSRNHMGRDINPYYIYLMQHDDSSIISIYKVPYHQSSEGGWRLKDFIAENIRDEKKTVPYPDYKFRCYYIPQGAILPEVRRDNLDTFQILMEQQQHSILEKEIGFKDAAYAVTCNRPFFNPDGTPFNGEAHNPVGWKNFIENDSRKQIMKRFDELMSSAHYFIGERSNEKQKTEYLGEMSGLIFTADNYQELVSKLYDSLQSRRWNSSNRETVRSLEKWLFPAFFFTGFGSNKWGDRDMLLFMEQTGMNVIRFYQNIPAMEHFFEWKGIKDLIGRYKKNVASIKSDVINSDRTGALENDRSIIIKDLKRLCGSEPEKVASDHHALNENTSSTLPGNIATDFRSWEQQNSADPSSVKTFGDLKQFWNDESEEKMDEENRQISFTPPIKY